MTDGMTDAFRMTQDALRRESYCDELVKYLKGPTKERLQAVIAAAKYEDCGGGFGGGSGRKLSENIEERLKKLRENDREEWIGLLESVCRERWNFLKLKPLSPFAGKLFIVVDYGIGFVNFYGDTEHFFRSLIEGKKGWKTYDGDKYAVILEKPNLEASEIVWLGGGNSCGPRSKHEPSTRFGDDDDEDD